MMLNTLFDIYSIGRRHSSEAKELTFVLWKPKIRYSVYNSPLLVPVLSHVNPLQISHPISLKYILILSFHLRLGSQSSLFLSYSPTKMKCAVLISPTHAALLTHLMLLDFIALIIFESLTAEREKSPKNSQHEFLYCEFFGLFPFLQFAIHLEMRSQIMKLVMNFFLSLKLLILHNGFLLLFS
jgi:hypothetical protein